MSLTIDDVDTRTGERREFRSTYELTAYHVDTIRVALSESIRTMIGYLNDPDSIATDDYWVTDLWDIDRALRALGIED